MGSNKKKEERGMESLNKRENGVVDIDQGLITFVQVCRRLITASV